MNTHGLIRTPDQRIRVFVSSTLRELAAERQAVKEAIIQLRMAPIMFELGARPHPAMNLYRAYLEQSHIFIGIYWHSYGYIAPGMEISGLEDEYNLAGEKPKLIYIKTPATDREAGLDKLLRKIKNDDSVSYKYFSSAEELRQLVENDLALLLTERFEISELKFAEPVNQHEFIQSNLPAQLSSFIGRENEQASLQDLLEKQQVRLVTLTGPGGTGKTRLSTQVATELIDQYKDGVFFVSLAEAREPRLVISKIAELLGIREGGSQSLLEGLKSYLRNKQILLLLDNFEQVLDAAPLICELLEAAPRVKIMVTSRSLLNVRGEYEFPVPPLQLPSPETSRVIEQLVSCESVRMFVERVKAINPSFSLDIQNGPVIAEICRRLDGLPLAIELAAARVKMLSLDGLHSLLSKRLQVLTGGSRDLPERQQTLQKTLEWSIQLLSQRDQTLFARLGVFNGGFTLESAREVCHSRDDTGMDIYKSVEALLNNSLVQLDRLDSPQPRFRMLETIREYAQERLIEAGELEEFRRRHAQYFINKINEVSPLFSTRDAEQGLAWVDVELDNLRTSMDCCVRDTHMFGMAPWLVIAMNWPWYRRGFLIEGRDWADRVLRVAVAQEDTLARCYALWASGSMAMWQGDLNNAQPLLEEALKLSKTIELPMAVAITLLFLGTTQVNRGEDQIALQYLQEALELYEQLGMAWHRAITLVHMGNASLGMGDKNCARTYLDQALPISREIGEKWLISLIMNNYGEIARTEGDYQKAQQCYEESEALLRAMGDKGDLARLVHNLGCIAQHVGNLELAEDRYKESLAMFVKLGNQRGIAECLASLAMLCCEQGQMVPAATLLSAGQALLLATGAAWWPADRGEVDRNREYIQGNLEPPVFRKAWEAGKKFDLTTAISYVQQVKPD